MLLRLNKKMVISALEVLLQLVTNLIKFPEDNTKKRVKVDNQVFHQKVGCLEGGEILMRSIGFCKQDNLVYTFTLEKGNFIYSRIPIR